MAEAVAEAVGYRLPWRVREFRGLVVAQVLSEWGDALSRVALAALVYKRTNSMMLGALAFSASYVPAVFGSAFLGSLADRLPRRRVMIACDLLRSVLFGLLALLAVPGSPTALLLGLLFVAGLFSVPFEAARAAVLPDVLPEMGAYVSGAALSRALNQIDQVLGLALAGVVVQMLGARWSLALDASSFVVSAVVLGLLMRRRPAPTVAAGVRYLTALREGAADVLGDRPRRLLLAFGWATPVLLVAPESVALAYAKEHSAGTVGGALLLATLPAGAAVSAILLGRLPLPRQIGLVLPMAAASCVPLLVTPLNGWLPLTVVLWFLCGLGQAFMLTLMATLTLLTEPGFRGRVNGFAAAGFSLGCAVALLLAGWLSDQTSAAVSVAVFGGIGLLIVGVVSVSWPARVIRERLEMAPAEG